MTLHNRVYTYTQGATGNGVMGAGHAAAAAAAAAASSSSGAVVVAGMEVVGGEDEDDDAAALRDNPHARVLALKEKVGVCMCVC